MSQRQQLERVLHIDRAIRNGEYPSADRLAQELECGRRVIFMDRQFMRDRLGAPIAYDRRRGGWYYKDTTWTLPATMISESELLASILGIKAAGRLIGPTLEGPLHSALEKIARSLHGPVQVDLQTLQQHCSFAPSAAVATDERTLLGLHAAIQAQRSVRIVYHTAERDAHTERIVDPHHLHNVAGSWYMIGFDHRRDKMLTFHVGRIRRWDILEQSFTRDPSFDAEQWLHSAFQVESGAEVVDFAIRFDSYEAAFIRDRRWHATQCIEELAEGGLILRFSTSSWGEVMRFVLQYGSHAEVLSPPELRDEIADEVQRMARFYAGAGEGAEDDAEDGAEEHSAAASSSPGASHPL